MSDMETAELRRSIPARSVAAPPTCRGAPKPSRGEDNGPATEVAVHVGVERGVDRTGQRSRKSTAAIVSESSLICVMTAGHLGQGKQMGGRGKVHVIDEYASGTPYEGIADPYGGNLDAYRATADTLETELEKLFDRIRG